MTKPLVSVYITNHNYGNFIEQAINSVLKQTLQDFEVIIIDDGSTDHSREIIARYEKLPQVVAIYQQNKGLNVTNNIALRAARGKYLMRLDADDYLDENALMIMADTLKRNPDIGLVFPDYYHVTSEGEIIEIIRRHDFDQVTLFDQPAHGACTMVRKRCLEEIGGYDESFSCQDGYYLWMKFIQLFPVKNINLPLFYYRQHGKSLTKNENRILETRSKIVEKQSLKSFRQLSATAIIPVRGTEIEPGSIALRPLCGKPFINWTIDEALHSSRISQVIVSTPDLQILEHLQTQYGSAITLVRRPRELAAFNTSIVDTIHHAFSCLPEGQQKTDVFAVLYTEAPFLIAHYIDTAIDLLELFNSDSVVAVRQEDHNVFQHRGKGLEQLRQSSSLRLEREFLFRDLGRMRIVRRCYFEKHNKILGGQIGHIVLDQTAALNVHSEWDWQLAELIASNLELFRPTC
ncbi:MAG: glycosyltransferase [Thermodesulfobacteriota bacterium]